MSLTPVNQSFATQDVFFTHDPLLWATGADPRPIHGPIHSRFITGLQISKAGETGSLSMELLHYNGTKYEG